MKVKVAFAGARLVIPCGNPKDKVERLVEAINARFRSHLGDPTLRVQELTTADGFLINVQDTIEQVIDDGAQLHALDYATWLQATLPNLSRVHWVARSDYAEGCSRPPLRYAEVGKHALHSNKVYVKVGTRHYGEDKDPRLWLFDADSLSTFGQQQEEVFSQSPIYEPRSDADDGFKHTIYLETASPGCPCRSQGPNLGLVVAYLLHR